MVVIYAVMVLGVLGLNIIGSQITLVTGIIGELIWNMQWITLLRITHAISTMKELYHMIQIKLSIIHVIIMIMELPLMITTQWN